MGVHKILGNCGYAWHLPTDMPPGKKRSSLYESKPDKWLFRASCVLQQVLSQANNSLLHSSLDLSGEFLLFVGWFVFILVGEEKVPFLSRWAN